MLVVSSLDVQLSCKICHLLRLGRDCFFTTPAEYETPCSLCIAGENCHRGAALGAILGATAAQQDTRVSTEFKENLRASKRGLLALFEQMKS